MDKIISLYLTENGSKSDCTKTTIKTGLKRLEKIIGKPFDKLTVKDFSNSDGVLDKITDMYSLNTTIGTILSIQKFLNYKKARGSIIEDYKEILNELIQERNKNQGQQKFKVGEKENWIDYLELKKKVESLSESYLNNKKSFTEYRNFLILALYTLVPPARIGNYLNMIKKNENSMKQKIDSLPKTHNYMIKTNDTYTMVFNQYKTSKILGKIKYEIKNTILNNLISTYLEKYNNNDKIKCFMINVSGKPMSQTGFTNAQSSITNRLFKKKLTNNMFRRIFFTWFLSTNPSVEEKQKVLRISGQNYQPSMVEKYDRKESVEKPEEVAEIIESAEPEKKKLYKSNRIK